MGVDAGTKSTGKGPAAAPQASGTPSAEASGAPIQIEPTDEEIRAWAEAERQRREAWLKGPTDEERAEFARRERERRLAELEDEPGAEGRLRQGRHAYGRYGREGQLAAEGAMSLLWRWSRRSLAELVQAGREWEEETGQTSTRRRVPLDDEDR